MSQLYIDKKYASIIAGRLRNVQYKGTSSVVLSFTHSCERAESRKRRGVFLMFKNRVFFKCHNCGAACSLGNFLKEYDAALAAEYRMELFRVGVFRGSSSESELPVSLAEPEPVKPASLIGLTSFKEIGVTNPARQYLDRRALPVSAIHKFWLAPKFYSWASQFESVFSKFKEQVPRLILPYYAADQSLIGFSCRAFGKEMPKYIQLRLNKQTEFIYGLDTLDTSKPIIAVEGQIDSLFLPNAIAVGSANYNLDFIHRHKDRVIIVPDNDFRRNPQVCEQLKRAITRGATVSLLPASWHKDINDIIRRDKISAADLMLHILSNQKSGASALLELTLERRC